MLVGVEEIHRYTGTDFTEEELDSVAEVSMGVQGELEHWLGRWVERRQIAEVAIPLPNGYLPLRQTPVYRVLSVAPTSDPYLVDIPSGGYTIDTDDQGNITAVEWPPDVIDPDTNLPVFNTIPYEIEQGQVSVSNMITTMGAPVNEYQVLYIGGYDGRNDVGLKLAMKRVIAREVATMNDDYVTVNQDSAERPVYNLQTGWQDWELRRLDRLRRRMVR